MNKKFQDRLILMHVLSTITLLTLTICSFLFKEMNLLIFVYMVVFSFLFPFFLTKQKAKDAGFATTWAYSTSYVLVAMFVVIVLSLLVIEVIPSSRNIIFGTYSDLKNILMNTGQ